MIKVLLFWISQYHSSIKEYGSWKILFIEISRYSKWKKTAENDLPNNGWNKTNVTMFRTLKGSFFFFVKFSYQDVYKRAQEWIILHLHCYKIDNVIMMSF